MHGKPQTYETKECRNKTHTLTSQNKLVFFIWIMLRLLHLSVWAVLCETTLEINGNLINNTVSWHVWHPGTSWNWTRVISLTLEQRVIKVSKQVQGLINVKIIYPNEIIYPRVLPETGWSQPIFFWSLFFACFVFPCLSLLLKCIRK